MLDVDDERFDRLVDEALDAVPDELASLVENTVVLVEDDPPGGEPLLGLYEGVAATERPAGDLPMLPDRITVFRNPLRRLCRDEAQLREQVRITVVHEIGHHFGLDDDRLRELGYG